MLDTHKDSKISNRAYLSFKQKKIRRKIKVPIERSGQRINTDTLIELYSQ